MLVALRKESVDRNITLPPFYAFSKVALRKESVDRNMEVSVMYRMNCQSLSARRAWIEILVATGYKSFRNVALRKESVDRNIKVCPVVLLGVVALRKESVDRNTTTVED